MFQNRIKNRNNFIFNKFFLTPSNKIVVIFSQLRKNKRSRYVQKHERRKKYF